MLFNRNSEYKDRHALFSPSKSYWVNYDDDKLDHFIFTNMAAARGTKKHALAHMLIELGQTLEDTGQTLNSYVNDAIGFRMASEQILVYSSLCFGTADAISFRDNLLRIHDLKTGTSRVAERQLLCYAALFCLEYEQKPALIEMELRFYQNDEITVIVPDPDEITHIMDRYVTSDRRYRQMVEELA